MADWYVYQHDGAPLGPWSTDAVAEAMLGGTLAPDVLVAAPGGGRWLRALDVPVIARVVEGIPTKQRLHDSGLRLTPGAYSAENGQPRFGSTMMIVKDEEILSVDEPPSTRRGLPGPSRSVDDTAQMTARPAMSFELEDEDEEGAAATQLSLPVDRSSSDPSPLPPSSTPLAPPPATPSGGGDDVRRRNSS